MAYENTTPVWDYPQTASFSQLPDDDFLALLQKQFPANTDPNPALFTNGINPQNLTQLPLPALTPPSEDSSPSPPNVNAEPHHPNTEHDDPALKRKASYDSLEDEGPSQKSQHTVSNKKGSARRKSGDAGGADQSRLLKRKEQNRAAQRAFRERKEKHVKDLEDKVAALEAKNEEAVSENENLRDLLSRLQGENLRLKQGSFSFSIPKNAGSSSQGHPTPPGNFSTPSPNINDSPPNLFDGVSTSSSIASSPPPLSTNSQQKSMFSNDPFDWNSLTSFDPAVLNLLDDSSQPTATDASMQMDFGFGGPLSPKMPYTTIASNPLFMSYANSFDSSPITIADDPNSFNFDTYQSWPVSTLPAPEESGSVFNGGYMTHQGPVDFDVLLQTPPPSISPVSHTNGLSNTTPSSSFNSNPNLLSLPRQSPASVPDEYDNHNKPCPKTREEFKMIIAAEGASPFAPAGNLHKSADGLAGTVISCQGTNLPKTTESDENVEVLTAWRTITSNPMFKDADINELCSEFTSKAKCDGRKVVLEPQSVHHILETFTKPR